MSDAAEYPPQTAAYLSWAAVRFITRPSQRALLWSSTTLMALLGIASLTLPFVRVESRVPGQGVVDADPGSVAAAATEDGAVDTRLVEPGSLVVKGQPLAILQLGPGGETFAQALKGLRANAAILTRVAVSRRLPAGLQTGGPLGYFADPTVRERAAALDDSLRKLELALRNGAEFAAPREEAVDASGRLAGALTEYIERHTVRSPASGTLLQFELPPHAPVTKGQAVAVVLPQDARLVARLTVDPRRAADVAPGQLVRYKLDAYPYQRYGLFEGRVLRIEQAADAQRGLYYVVRATIVPPSKLTPRLASGVRLLVGMKADGRIVLGRRRLWELAVESLFGKR